jgi:hypothetical protein
MSGCQWQWPLSVTHKLAAAAAPAARPARLRLRLSHGTSSLTVTESHCQVSPGHTLTRPPGGRSVTACGTGPGRPGLGQATTVGNGR